MIRVALVGLGKMGLSHLATFRAHPDVDIAAVVDSSGYVVDMLGKYTGLPTFTDLDDALRSTELDAVVVATPTALHHAMVSTAVNQGLHVFCEKPLGLSGTESAALAALAERHGVVTQVGYHNRFVAAFREAKWLVDAGAIGRVNHVLAEAYGPVVLKPTGSTWRSRGSEGGGCLYDYAAHPTDLVTWLLGQPSGVGGTAFRKVFSATTEDSVVSTLYFANGTTGQLCVNWSDASYRKMTTRLTLTGTTGTVAVDRQECRVFLTESAIVPAGYKPGWNVKYTTSLTPEVWYYLRGEEYSAQVDEFVQRVGERRVDGTSTFASAAVTDAVLELMRIDAEHGPRTVGTMPGGSGSTFSDAVRPTTLRELATPLVHELTDRARRVCSRWASGKAGGRATD